MRITSFYLAALLTISCISTSCLGVGAYPNLQYSFTANDSSDENLDFEGDAMSREGRSYLFIKSDRSQCATGVIQENITTIVENPFALDAIVACSSRAVPFIINSLSDRNRLLGVEEKSDHQILHEILLINALSEIGSDAASAERTLVGLLNETYDRRLIFYTLEKISGSHAFLRIAENSANGLDLRFRAAQELIEIGESELAISPLTDIVLSSPQDCDNLRINALENLRNIDFELADSIEAIMLPLNDFCPIPLPTPASDVRSAAIRRLQSRRPEICNYSALRTVFYWICR